jgi:hypothetical protein
MFSSRQALHAPGSYCNPPPALLLRPLPPPPYFPPNNPPPYPPKNAPLESQRYELLSSQPLSFHNDMNCPTGYPFNNSVLLFSTTYGQGYMPSPPGKFTPTFFQTPRPSLRRIHIFAKLP